MVAVGPKGREIAVVGTCGETFYGLVKEPLLQNTGQQKLTLRNLKSFDQFCVQLSYAIEEMF